MFCNQGRGVSQTKNVWRPLHKPKWYDVLKQTRHNNSTALDLFTGTYADLGRENFNELTLKMYVFLQVIVETRASCIVNISHTLHLVISRYVHQVYGEPLDRSLAFLIFIYSVFEYWSICIMVRDFWHNFTI